MIVYPNDWQAVDTDILGVVCEALPQDCLCICLLWTEREYIEKLDWREREVLAKADTRQKTGGVDTFFLKDLKHYGRCVTSVVIYSDPLICWNIGVTLIPSRVSTVLANDRRVIPRLFETTRFPLSDVWTEHSNYQRSPLIYEGQVEMVDFGSLIDAFQDAPEMPGTIRVTICHASETHESKDVLLTEYCHGLELLPPQNHTWVAAETYYVLLQQVTACLTSGHVVFEDHYRWGDACPSPDFVDPATSWLPGGFLADGKRGVVDMRRWELRSPDAVPMLVANAGRNNYGHWLQNSIMAMFFVRDAIIAGKILPVTPPLTDRQMRPLELIGITRDKILEINEPALYFSEMIYPSFLSTHNTSYPGKWGLDCYNVIRQRANSRFGGSPPDYVYFTRKGYSGGHIRGIENEDELIDMLCSIGFHLIAPHENTFDQNLYLISRAKIIVSQFGAAMADIPFAPKGCVVIELICDRYFHNVHQYLTHLFEQKLIRIIEPIIPESVGSPDGWRFRVSVDMVRRAALAIMNG